MTRCPLWCEGGRALRKEQTHQKRTELQALRLCHNGPTPLFQEELKLEKMPLQTCSPDWGLRNRLFLTHIFPELTEVDLRATAMTSQHLAEGTRCSKEILTAVTLLPTYVTEFQSVFVKEDFDILLEHCKWDHTIELIPGVEPKSSKVYL